MEITDELTRYIHKHESRTRTKPGAIPVTKEEKQILTKLFLEQHYKQIQEEDLSIAPDLMVMEFGGIDLYEHPSAKEIREK